MVLVLLAGVLSPSCKVMEVMHMLCIVLMVQNSEIFAQIFVSSAGGEALTSFP